nr:ATP-binding protein [Pseudomonadota bacterium]
HPHMVDTVLDLFLDQRLNPHDAQALFTCHSLEILNFLHKSQVLLVQKNDECGSEAWRLDEIPGVRNDDNLYAKYMAGAYGAVPNL